MSGGTKLEPPEFRSPSAGAFLFARVAPPVPRRCVRVDLVDVLAVRPLRRLWGILRNSSVKGR